MKGGSTTIKGWKATISVAMSNYIDAGSIIAIATSLGFWQSAFGLTDAAKSLMMCKANSAAQQRIKEITPLLEGQAVEKPVFTPYC